VSYVKPERRPVSFWRVRAATIGQMIDQGWVVWSVCAGCFLTMQIDLDVMEFKLGDHETLWNRHPSCRRIGCEGLITFHGVPPETNHVMALRAEWPKEWANAPPPAPARRAPEDRASPLAEPRLPSGMIAHARRRPATP
jgi:hypothetical protein